LRYRERGNFATHQLRYPFAGINRAGTGGVGRIAWPMGNPVYPRQDNQNDECSGGRNQAQAADFPQ